MSSIMLSFPVSLRRKALKNFNFSDGTEIVAGDSVCVSLRAMGRDSAHLTNAHTFDGFRFVTKPGAKGIKYTENNPVYPYWGYGKESW